MPYEVMRLSHVYKNQHGSRALRDVHLNFYQGECHGILIHNHLSRNMLVDVLTGIQTPDKGSLWFNDQRLSLQSTLHARSLGIYSIRTQSQLIPNMSIAENLFLTNRDYYRKGFTNQVLMRSMAKDILKDANLLHINPDDPAFTLTPPQVHMIELLKNLAYNPKVLILDNVFDHYTQREFAALGALLEHRPPACTVIFLSNRYNSLFQIAQRISVFRTTSSAITLDQYLPISHQTLQAYQSSKVALPQHTPTQAAKLSNDNIFYAKNIRLVDQDVPFSFSLRKNELLGLIDEDGQYAQNISALFDAPHKLGGALYLDEQPFTCTNYLSAEKQGLFLIQAPGNSTLFHNMPLYENITLSMHGPIYNRLGLDNISIKKYSAREALATLHAERIWAAHGDKNSLPIVSRSDEFIIRLACCLLQQTKVLFLVNPHLYFDDLSIQMLPDLLDAMRSHVEGIVIFSISPSSIEDFCDRMIWVS